MMLIKALATSDSPYIMDTKNDGNIAMHITIITIPIIRNIELRFKFMFSPAENSGTAWQLSSEEGKSAFVGQKFFCC